VNNQWVYVALIGVGFLDSAEKILPCFFLPDVLCSFRKSEKSVPMDRCFKCKYYRRFMREMDEEEERVWAEIDKIRKYGYPKGELE